MTQHHKPSRASRTVGALLALHAGDSLGATYEFQPHASIRAAHPGPNASFPHGIVGGGPFHWKPGAATDDTDMTRAVLLAYHDVLVPNSSKQQHQPGHGLTSSGSGSGSSDVVYRAAEYFQMWFTATPSWPGRREGTHPPDVGGATQQGITNFMTTRDPARSGAGEGSAGNGSLMRCLPTGLFRSASTMELLDESMSISAVTHRDTRCKIACAVYNCMINALVVKGLGPSEAVAAGLRAAKVLDHGKTDGPVYAAVELGRRTSLPRMADEGPHPSMYPHKCGGYVLDTLAVAVAALMDPRSLEDILIDVVRIGKDTDTNTAVAGGLLGARDGEEAIPEEWKEVLQFGSEFRQKALEILRIQNVPLR